MSMPRPADPPIEVESVVLRVRRHGRVLTLPVLVLIAVAGSAGFWVGALPEPWMNVSAAAGAALVALLLGVAPVMSWLAARTLITSRRVIVRRGLLVQDRREVSLAQVREVRSRRTLMQRIIGSGDIELLAGVDQPTRLRDVPGCLLVAEALQGLVESNFAQATSRPAGDGAWPTQSIR